MAAPDPSALKTLAERKMAIVDALTPEHRAVVWEIGLNAFSRDRRYAKAYRIAKLKAGVRNGLSPLQCKRTKLAEVA